MSFFKGVILIEAVDFVEWLKFFYSSIDFKTNSPFVLGR